MKCLLTDCQNEVKGRAKTCSPTHRKALSRSVTQTVTSVTLNRSVTLPSNEALTVTSKNVTVRESVTKSKQSVTFEPTSVTSKGIKIIDGKVYENGHLVAEDDLNVFYRGLKGKFELSSDLLNTFNVSPIVLKEKDRKAMIEAKMTGAKLANSFVKL